MKSFVKAHWGIVNLLVCFVSALWISFAVEHRIQSNRPTDVSTEDMTEQEALAFNKMTPPEQASYLAAKLRADNPHLWQEHLNGKTD